MTKAPTCDVVVLRNPLSARAKAHLFTVYSRDWLERDLGRNHYANCGAVVPNSEVVSVTRVAPEDRCGRCGPVTAWEGTAR